MPKMGPAVAGDVTWDVTFSSKRSTRILYVVLGMSWKIYGWLVVTIIKPSFLHCMRRDLHPQVPQPWWRMLPKDSRRYGATSRDGWILLLQWCWQQRAWRLPISHGGTIWIPKNEYSSYYGKSHYKRWFGGTPFEQWSNPVGWWLYRAIY